MEGSVMMAAGGLALAVLGWMGTALYSRLVATLDKTAERLDDVAKITAAHGARLDILERQL